MENEEAIYKVMNGLRSHMRYKEIDATGKQCCENCPEGGLPMRVVLFINDNKLRCHAVKHPTKDDEKESWQHLIGSCIGIDKIIEELKKLGCAVLSAGSNYFMCDNSQYKCNLYDACSRIVKDLQDKYLRIAENVIREGIRLPRYVCFTEDRKKKLLVVAELNHAGQNILARGDSFLHEEHVYNLATCLLPPRSLTQIQNDIREQMRARNGVIWCRPETWGIPQNRLNLERFLR